MKQKFSRFKAAFLRDRLFATTCIFLLFTVASAFLGSVILNITIPLVGEIFPFRIFLPITFILYLVWAFKGNDHPWRDCTTLEKWAYVLVGVMVVYGAVSLLWVQNFLFTFKRLFNLCFDVAFFFLLLRLCRNKRVLQAVILTAMAGFLFFCGVGIYEVFHQGIFDDAHDHIHIATWFMKYLQHPIATAGNTNDYCAILVFLAAVFMLVRALGVFDKHSRFIKYSPLAIFPLLFFLITMANSRLNMVSFWILLVVTVLHDLLGKYCKKRLYAVLALVLCSITFCHQYRFIVPPVQAYVQQVKAYRAYQVALREYYEKYGSLAENDGSVPPPPTMPGNLTDKPTLDLGDQEGSSLKDEFLETDQDGNVSINSNNSGGVRTLLLIHAGNCFRESYGLGVGLGNTEVLAAKRGVIPKWASNDSISIHCFIARIIADYGIFALIPLCAIAFLLIRKVWQMFVAAWKAKNNALASKALVLLGCSLIFPISSTASSDAQDILPMWLFLAILFFLSEVCWSKASSDQ